MQETKYFCDFCGNEVKTRLQKGDSLNPPRYILDLWEVSFRKCDYNGKIQTQFSNDIHFGRSGQACKECIEKYPKSFQYKKQSLEKVE